mmetsp:Transcript_90841/g.236664  ORF Transcript_90841/g.236664 Transcript_90841/m.236664 type:complete len:595 (+) Transcript_90841:2-1786(+)
MDLVMKGIKDLSKSHLALLLPADSPTGSRRPRVTGGPSACGRAPEACSAEEFASKWKAYRATNPRLRDPKALPALMRRGVPDALRAEVWAHCLGLEEVLVSAGARSGGSPGRTPPGARELQATAVVAPLVPAVPGGEPPEARGQAAASAPAAAPATAEPLPADARADRPAGVDSATAAAELQPALRPAGEAAPAAVATGAAPAPAAEAEPEVGCSAASVLGAAATQPAAASTPEPTAEALAESRSTSASATRALAPASAAEGESQGGAAASCAAAMPAASLEAVATEELQLAKVEGSLEAPAAERDGPGECAPDSLSDSAVAEEVEAVSTSPLADTVLPQGVSEQIEVDVLRTFPNDMVFREMGGPDHLRRVLRQLALDDAELGYCQSMNFVAAVFIMVFRDDQLALPAMQRTLLKLGARSWYTDGMKQLRADTAVLEDLLRERLPDVHRTFQIHKFDLIMIVSKWFLCLYTTVMEGETLRRVWDAVLCDGVEAVFRVALAALACREAAITQARSIDDLFHLFQDCTPGTGPGPDELMRAAYDERLVGRWSRVWLADRRRQAAQKVSTADTRLEMRQQALWRGGVRPACVLAHG